MNIAELQAKSDSELQALAKEYDVSAPSELNKQDLIMELLRADTEKEGLIFAQGILEILPDGYGFLRVNDYSPGPDDVYVSPVADSPFFASDGRSRLWAGRKPKEGERYYALLRVKAVNFRDPEEALKRPHFDQLTPVYPDTRLRLEVKGQKDVATRLIDIIAPLGKGQRGLICRTPESR